MNPTTDTLRSSGRPLAQVGLAALVAASMAFGAVAGTGDAFAAPRQGGIGGGEAPRQGGFGGDAQGERLQGGITPTPAPEQTPEPVPEAVPHVPPPTPGPGGLPAAPTAPPTEWTAVPPSYHGGYDPTPRVIHAPDPAAPRVKRIAPAPQTLRIGNFERPNKDIPDFPNKAAYIDWANGWAAYAEQQIANTLISMGMAEEDEASRQAAAIVMGAAGAGAIGGAVAFTATTVTVGLFSVSIGAYAGGLTGGPTGALGGAAIGAGVAVGAGAAAGLGTAVVAGLIGGVAGWALGSGDKGHDAPRPDALPQTAPRVTPGPAPATGPNQFEVRLDENAAAQAGLPPVEYVVTGRGDVGLSAGGARIGWTAEQAQAPIQALGSAAPAVEKAIDDGVVAAAEVAREIVPALRVEWPGQGGRRAAHHR